MLPIEDASLPAVVRLKLQDNCIPVVCAGEKVAEGEKVAANADGFCLLSSVCGTVMSAGDGFVTVRSERSGEPVGPSARSNRRWFRSATRMCPSVSNRRESSAQ